MLCGDKEWVHGGVTRGLWELLIEFTQEITLVSILSFVCKVQYSWNFDLILSKEIIMVFKLLLKLLCHLGNLEISDPFFRLLIFPLQHVLPFQGV